MIVTIFFRRDDKAIVVQESKIIGNTYISLIYFVVYGFEFLSRSIYKNNIEIILVSVQCLYTENIGFFCPLQARNIVSIQRNLCSLSCFYIIQIKAYYRVLFSCFWIFESVFSRIQSSSIDIHRKFWYFMFIKTNISQLSTIRIPIECSYNSKFFLIYPIAGTIDYFILLSIKSYLLFLFGLSIIYVNIIFIHIRYFISLWREERLLDFFICKFSQFLLF